MTANISKNERKLVAAAFRSMARGIHPRAAHIITYDYWLERRAAVS